MRTLLAALLLAPGLAAASDCSGTSSGVYRPEPAAAGILAPQNAINVHASRATWTRTGGVVSVTGMVNFTPQASGPVQFYLPLPVPSRHTDSFGLSGAVTANPIARAVTVAGLVDADNLVNFRTEAGAADVGLGMVVQYVYAYPLADCFP